MPYALIATIRVLQWYGFLEITMAEDQSGSIDLLRDRKTIDEAL